MFLAPFDSILPVMLLSTSYSSAAQTALPEAKCSSKDQETYLTSAQEG